MPKKTKILFCVPSPSNRGGITIWSKIIIDFFKLNSIDDVELVHFPMDRSVSLTGLMSLRKRIWYAVKDYSFFPIRLLISLYGKHFDKAHIATVGGWMGSIRDIFFVLICKFCRVKSIVHYHCGTIPEICKTNDWKWRLQAFVIKKSYRVLVLDEASQFTLLSLGYKNVEKVPNPLPKELKRNTCGKDIKREIYTILFVGHVIREKGIFELLDAIRDMENVKVDIFGPQNIEINQIIRGKIHAKEFKAKIIFHGIQSSDIIYENMRTASLFVLPTYTEGFPLVIMEAMACGCPIISTPVGAIKEMLTVGNEIAGYLIPIKNSNALRSEIEYCFTHKKEVLRKTVLAKEKVFSTYSMEIIMKQLKEIWQS